MRRGLPVIILLFGLSGCALTTEQIELQYIPQTSVSSINGAHSVVVNVHVNDQRQDKSKVSSKKNGYGMEMAPILATEDVTVTIRRAIEQELRSRGFLLGTDAIVSVAADLTRFYNDHKIGFFAGDAVADLNMGVTVKGNAGQPLFSRQVIAQGTEPNTQLATGNNARIALDRALQNGMKILFREEAFISALLDASKK